MDLREARPGATGRHPWEQARLGAIRRILESTTLPPRPGILDIGCGDGWLLARLGDALHAQRRVGLDPALGDAPATAVDPGIEAHEAFDDLPDAPFDVVLLLDVLEHVGDDDALLRQAAARLAPGGRLLATVPAHPALFGAHDTFLRHQRRYRPKALVGLAAQAGLAVERSGGLFGTLLAPRIASVLAQRLRLTRPAPQGVGAWRGGRFITEGVTRLLDLDNAVHLRLARHGLSLPGLTAWMLCRRA